MKRARPIAVVVLSAIVLAAVGVSYSLWRNEGPLWRLVMLKRVSYKATDHGHPIVGWYTVRRWSDQPLELDERRTRGEIQ